MQDPKEQIKTRIDIVDLVGRYVKLKKVGTNYKALCPFHSENTPSFFVNPDLQIFKCFGCNKSGDVFTFFMEMEGVEFIDALKTLAEESDVELPKQSKKYKNDSKKDKYYEINKIAQKFYTYTLTNLEAGKKALEYLKKRGLNKEHIEQFNLGYAPNSWNSLYDYLLSKDFEEKDISKVGLIKKSKNGNYYDTFRGRIIFPLYSYNNKIVSFAGRTVFNETPKYINTKDTPIFKKRSYIYNLDKAKTEIKKKKTAIVTEGEFDAIRPYIKGIRNTVALKGTSFTRSQAKLLKRYAETAVIFFDSDTAGDEAALRGIQIAQNLDLDVKIATLPSGYADPDEAATDSIDIIYKAVDEALPAYDYYFSYAKKKFSTKDALDKKRIANFLTPKIKNISDPILRSHYTKKLSELIDVSEDSVLQMSQPEEKEIEPTEEMKDPVKEVMQEVSYLFLHLIRADRFIFKDFVKKVKEEELLTKREEELINKYKTNVINGEKSKKEFIQENEYDFLEDVFLVDLESFEESEDNQERILNMLYNKERRKKLKNRLNELTQKIKKAEEDNNKENLDKLQKEFKILTSRIKDLQ